ncbi:phage holin family protein [Lachnospiraceae bacterium MD329]|nr:phage holin family protein [Lachnospiraceae bacterium MD329]
MDKIFNGMSVITAMAGGIIAVLFGAWDKLLYTLMILMVLDYALGIIKAVYTKTLSSEIGFKGLLKKIAMLVIVALANTIQNLMGGNVAVREIVIMFYIANEGISILENAAVILPQMPEKLKDILLQLRGDNNENRH